MLVVHVHNALGVKISVGDCCQGSYVPYDSRLSHAKAGDESTGIDGPQVTVGSSDHENHNTNSPSNTQDSRTVDTANAITN